MGWKASFAAMAAPAVLFAAPAEAATPSGDSQSGFYIGLHVGYGLADDDWIGPPNPIPVPPLVSQNTADHRSNGLALGGTIGGRWQTGYMVIGLEAEASWTDLSDRTPSTAFAGFFKETDVDWTGSVTAQIGINAGSILPYLEAGVAFVGDNYTIVDQNGVAPDETDSVSDTRTGVVLGAGVDVQLGGGWAARGEYNYLRFGESDYTISGEPWQIDQSMHLFRFGILLRFGS